MTENTRTSLPPCPSCGGIHSPTDPCAVPQQGARSGAILDSKYALVRLLGEGGMGEVYEARHTKIGRRLAVKFLHGQFAKRPEVAKRFENEARAAGEVEHENIGGVYDVGALPDGTQYLVMEFLDGEDLDHVLKREYRLPLARAADLLIQACQGLDVVHRRGIIHRDLKPANLFLTKRANGTDLVKVLDFGIAKLKRPEGDASATETGMALGTAYYMSPEQARGARDIGPQSDVYALGVIFYELLSGRRPHDGTSLLQILHQILTQPPTPLEEVCPGLPPPVYQIVRTAMALSPADRFAGVGGLAEALAPFAGGVYRLSQSAVVERPMEATRIETGGLRVGNTPVSGAPAQSVVGMSRSAAPPGRRTRGIALAVGAVALVAIGVEGYVSLRAKGGKAGVGAEGAASVAASANGVAPAGVGAAAGASAAGAVAAAAATGIGTSAAAAAPEVTAAAAASSVPPSGQDLAAVGRADDVVPPSDGKRPHHDHGSSGASHGSSHGSAAPGTAPSAPAAAAAAGKPDCRQTYTIDSDGNKHFRPECFGSK